MSLAAATAMAAATTVTKDKDSSDCCNPSTLTVTLELVQLIWRIPSSGIDTLLGKTQQFASTLGSGFVRPRAFFSSKHKPETHQHRNHKNTSCVILTP
jgi:hypothetical protein